MKKIYIVAGIVLLFVLILTAWLFIIDFGGFAQKLGGGAADIASNEKSEFIGTWETTYIEDDDRFVGYNGVYRFSIDGTGSVGGLTCTWDIENDTLVIDYYGGVSTLTYDYSFENDADILVLTNSNDTLLFIKRET